MLRWDVVVEEEFEAEGLTVGVAVGDMVVEEEFETDGVTVDEKDQPAHG